MSENESRPSARYRVAELSKRTGLSRQTIHFYVQQGLLPPGQKSGRTNAWYGPEHLERLETIRRLQSDHFLPLKAVRAVLENAEGGFTAAQRRQLSDLKRELPSELRPDKAEGVPLKKALHKTGVSEQDARALARLGLLRLTGAGANAQVASEDLWLLELWRDVRAAGFSAELGFDPSVLGIFEDAVAAMYERELKILSKVLKRVSAAEGAALVERALPLIHEFLRRRHEAKIRELFASLRDDDA